MTPGVRVALSATTQSWRPQLSEFIRDHVAGMTATTVRDQHALRGDPRSNRGGRRFEVVVVDDVMRIFSAADVGAAQDRGTRFIGVFDPHQGRGQPYLVDLGVDVILPAATPVAELVASIRELCPVEAEADPADVGVVASRPAASGRRGRLTVLSRVCGGVGSTETGVAMANALGRGRRTLLIEADELAPSAAGRLGRDPDFGLARALGRVSHGHRVLPEGLSPRAGGPEGFRADIICGTALPGGPPVMKPSELQALVDEALCAYDEVVVETNVLVAGSSELARDRFTAGRAVLVGADRVVVLSRPDGDGAMRLVHWVPAASAAGVSAALWAVFGRAPRSRYQRANVAEVVASHLPPGTFRGVHFLPEDPAVGRAKWNGELVRGGRWLGAVEQLAADMVSRSPAASAPQRRGGVSRPRASGRTRTGATA